MNIAQRVTPAIVPQELLERIRALVGAKGFITDPEAMEPHLTERRQLYVGKTPVVVKPANAEQVAEIVRLCAAARVPIVPQSGNTSLCGASVPHEHGGEIVLSLQRLNQIIDVDPLNYTMTVEAGVILQNVQQAAADADRLFPLSLGAEGTCLIGGNLSTNAGGIQVLHYGNARNLVLGLEVVLPDGQIWDGLRALKKDNTGYDLKQIFMGAEGTLGIITKAVLKLFPKPKDMATAFIAVPDPRAALDVLSAAREAGEDNVTSFELLDRVGLDMVLSNMAGFADPLAQPYRWYVLTEWWSTRANSGLNEKMENFLAAMIEQGKVLDGALAQSQAQRAYFWKIREAFAHAPRMEGGTLGHDVSVPVARVPDFIAQATAKAHSMVEGVRPMAFGHLGDGNIHFNVVQPKNVERAEFLKRYPEFNRAVHDIVMALNGSISAEHGIGRLKLQDLEHYRSQTELDIMRKIKRALDPHGIMNPHKIFEV